MKLDGLHQMPYLCDSSHHGSILSLLNTSVQEPKATSICGSCGCSVEKSKSTGWQGKPVTPTEPNPTLKRTVINYGDKQHFTAWSLLTGCYCV